QEQLGPCRAARAMAITHIAMFEVMVGSEGGIASYTNLPPPGFRLSESVAIAQAAHDTLVALYPSQTQTFDDALLADLNEVADGSRKTNGIQYGQQSASLIMAMRFNDGAQVPEPVYGVDYIAGNAPGEWRQDPISLIPIVLGGHWEACLPFVI